MHDPVQSLPKSVENLVSCTFPYTQLITLAAVIFGGWIAVQAP